MAQQIISREAWAQRYTERLAEAGISRPYAMAAAQVAVEHAGDWLTPEDAAVEELSYWVEEA